MHGDAGLLRQVFSNLIGNAIKFSPDTPKVRIAATHPHDRWVITIKDEGIGIAEDPPTCSPHSSDSMEWTPSREPA